MKKDKCFEATEFNNIKEIIYNSANKYANTNAFIIKNNFNERDASAAGKYTYITYKAFLKDINSLGTAFFKREYRGKRIALLGKNCYEWALTHFTNLIGGIVSVPLDKELHDVELSQSVIRSKADVIVFDSKYVDKIEKLKSNEEVNVKEYISMEKLDGYLDILSIKNEGEKLLKKGNKEYVNYKIDSEKMSILLFTSGTSANSKAVMLSQKNIASNIYAMQLVEPIGEGDVNIALLPFHHIFGSTCIAMMLACGVTNTFADGIRYVAQNLKEYKVSIFVGVPILIESIYKNIQKQIKKQGKEKVLKLAKVISNVLYKCRIDVRRKMYKVIIDQLGGSLRFIIAGGAPLQKDIYEYFNSIGIQLVQGYGLTETAPVLAAESAFAMKAGSVGKTMQNVEIQIVDKDENGIGEVRVKGPNVMLGYYENEELTKEVIKDGWFYTGDLGYFDEEGYLFLTGRKKDMIVLYNGKKVFPEEIEALINKLDLVDECMVFGLPKDDGDVKLSVKVVLDKDVVEKEYKEKTQAEIEEILWGQIKEINKSFPKYKYIKHLIISDEELIKTTTKKIKRGEEMKKILAAENV
jgi:long-chain acyl-CoA synthetase